MQFYCISSFEKVDTKLKPEPQQPLKSQGKLFSDFFEKSTQSTQNGDRRA